MKIILFPLLVFISLYYSAKVEGGKNFFENVPKSCYECENPTRTQVIYSFIFDSCLSTNPQKFAVQKVILNGTLNISDNRCTKHDCSPYSANYIVIVNGRKKVSTINFDKSRVIYEKGNINLFSSGHVEEGFFEGAYVGEVASYLNDDPNACDSKTGLTFIKSNYLSIVFEKKGKFFACTGCSTYSFSPGLVTK